jgi:hypothetical protein
MTMYQMDGNLVKFKEIEFLNILNKKHGGKEEKTKFDFLWQQW